MYYVVVVEVSQHPKCSGDVAYMVEGSRVRQGASVGLGVRFLGLQAVSIVHDPNGHLITPFLALAMRHLLVYRSEARSYRAETPVGLEAGRFEEQVLPLFLF